MWSLLLFKKDIRRPLRSDTMTKGLQNLIFGSRETLKTVDTLSSNKKHSIVFLFVKGRVQIFLFFNLNILHFLLKKQNIH